MNSQELRQKLEQLDDATWQQLLAGKALRLVDDERLELADATERNLIVPAQNDSGLDASSLRGLILDQARELVDAYYLRNPLSLNAFTRQVKSLMRHYGAAAFAAEYGELPERTLFVEVGDVLAETSESPRHRYGAYCELDEPLSGQALEERVAEWLDSHEAYEKYISMNICRYSC
jgi:hypothetical protein